MRRKKKRKIGSSLLAIVLALLLTSDVIAGTKKRKPEAGQYGMVAVTVFREPGFALPGAELVLIPSPESGPPPGKSDFLTGKSDARGEYVFRVPTAAMRYKLKASAKGFVPQEKMVSIEGETRLDATFLLAPESK